jgi:hypothetical protein
MSIFKRLLNLGRGKVRAAGGASNDGSGRDALDEARHAAADAAEAIAAAIRPESVPEPPTVTPAEVEEASSPARSEGETPDPTPRQPAKRRL